MQSRKNVTDDVFLDAGVKSTLWNTSSLISAMKHSGIFIFECKTREFQQI